MSEQLIDLLIAITAALAAGLIAIASNTWLQKRNKRREERVRFLIKAYVDLENGHAREISEDMLPYSLDEQLEFHRRFNNAIVAINLMGSADQIKICRDVPNDANLDFTQLSLSLRDSLRKELGLEKLTVGHFWFEMRRNRAVAKPTDK